MWIKLWVFKRMSFQICSIQVKAVQVNTQGQPVTAIEPVTTSVIVWRSTTELNRPDTNLNREKN